MPIPFIPSKNKQALPLIAMAVQEPTLTYKDPQTGKPFTKAELCPLRRKLSRADINFLEHGFSLAKGKIIAPQARWRDSSSRNTRSAAGWYSRD